MHNSAPVASKVCVKTKHFDPVINAKRRANSRDSFAGSTRASAAKLTGLNIDKKIPEKKASQNVEAAISNDCFGVEPSSPELNKEVLGTRSTSANRQRCIDGEELEADGTVAKSSEKGPHNLRDLSITHREQRGLHRSGEINNNDTGIASFSECIRSLERILLNIVVFNRDLQLELLDTRLELMRHKCLLRDQRCRTATAGLPLLEDEKEKQEKKPNDRISGRKTTASRCRGGEEHGVFIKGKEQRSKSASASVLPKRLLSLKNTLPRVDSVNRWHHCGSDVNPPRDVHFSSCLKKRTPTPFSTVRRQDSLAQRESQCQTSFFSRDHFDTEQALKLIEALKRSITRGSRSPQHRPPAETTRLHAPVALTAASTGGPYANRGAADLARGARGVWKGGTKKTQLLATRHRSAQRSASARRSELPRSPRSPGKAVFIEEETSPCRPTATATGDAAAKAGDSERLEALQRLYWEQSRGILDQLDQMLADD